MLMTLNYSCCQEIIKAAFYSKAEAQDLHACKIDRFTVQSGKAIVNLSPTYLPFFLFLILGLQACRIHILLSNRCTWTKLLSYKTPYSFLSPFPISLPFPYLSLLFQVCGLCGILCIGLQVSHSNVTAEKGRFQGSRHLWWICSHQLDCTISHHLRSSKLAMYISQTLCVGVYRGWLQLDGKCSV